MSECSVLDNNDMTFIYCTEGSTAGYLIYQLKISTLTFTEFLVGKHFILGEIPRRLPAHSAKPVRRVFNILRELLVA